MTNLTSHHVTELACHGGFVVGYAYDDIECADAKGAIKVSGIINAIEQIGDDVFAYVWRDDLPDRNVITRVQIDGWRVRNLVGEAVAA